MKRTERGIRVNTQRSRATQQAKAKPVSRDEKILKPAISADCLLDKSSKNIQQRKASTPTHDRTALSNSPDISSIQINEENHLKKKFGPEKPKGTGATKTAIQKDINLQDELDIEYTRYLQAAFKNELLKSSSSKINNDLTNLQHRIEENERILRQTTERLNNISFNKEIVALYKLHNPNYTLVLDRLDKTNCDDYISKLNTKLEQTQNQLKTKNIEIPEGGGAQLMEVISDTLSAFEKLKTAHDVETPRILKEIKEVNKSTINSLKRCTENLSSCEDLLLNRATLEISAQQDS